MRTIAMSAPIRSSDADKTTDMLRFLGMPSGSGSRMASTTHAPESWTLVRAASWTCVRLPQTVRKALCAGLPRFPETHGGTCRRAERVWTGGEEACAKPWTLGQCPDLAEREHVRMTSRSTPSKVLLVLDGDGRVVAQGGPEVPVRRYRLARILPEYRVAASKGDREAPGVAATRRPVVCGPAAEALVRRPRRALGFAQMAQQIEPSRSRHPIMRRAVAALVLVAAAVLVFHVVAGLVVAVFWIVAVIAVIAAVVWAARELF